MPPGRQLQHRPCALVQGAHDTGGAADDQAVLREHLAFGHQRAGADDGAGADHCAVEDDRAHADQRAVTHGAAVQDGAMTDRHVGAVADQVEKALRDAGFGKPRIEGLPHCDWVLVDAGDVIVHIFRPEVREFYNIEKMWQAEFADNAN